jgi:hypothetical protein
MAGWASLWCDVVALGNSGRNHQAHDVSPPSGKLTHTAWLWPTTFKCWFHMHACPSLPDGQFTTCWASRSFGVDIDKSIWGWHLCTAHSLQGPLLSAVNARVAVGKLLASCAPGRQACFWMAGHVLV